jgi:hypothetical protein
VPLSDHEQRLLEQIERALYADDPKFESRVRATDPHHVARRRMIEAGVVFALGVALMVVGIGLVKPGGIPVLSLAGFLVMFAAAWWFVQNYRRFTGRVDPNLRVVGGSGRRVRRRGILNRMEDRWRRRTERGDF